MEKEGLGFTRKEFERGLKEGLKLSHGLNLDLIPADEQPILVPTSPVAFAYVAGPTPKMILIPLPVNSFSVSAQDLPRSSCVRVTVKGSWTILPSVASSSPTPRFCLAVPVGDSQPGALKTYRFLRLPNCPKPRMSDTCCSYYPLFDVVHFVLGPKIGGSGEVAMVFNYCVRMFKLPDGKSGFSIPLRFPFYTTGFCGGESGPVSGRHKLRLSISAPDDHLIKHYTVNFPLKVMVKEDDAVMLYHESQGSEVKWTDLNLVCQIAYVLKAPAERPAKRRELEKASSVAEVC